MLTIIIKSLPWTCFVPTDRNDLRVLNSPQQFVAHHITVVPWLSRYFEPIQQGDSEDKTCTEITNS